MVLVRSTSSVGVLAVLLLIVPALADEKKIPVEDLPKVVLKAAQKAFPEAQLVGASKEVEEDDTIYEVEMKLNGKSIDLEIDDEGEVLSVEKEIEVDELPKAVTRAVAKLFPKAKITKVEEVSDEDDRVVNELTLATEGRGEQEVVFSPNGRILDDDDDDDDEKGDQGKTNPRR